MEDPLRSISRSLPKSMRIDRRPTQPSASAQGTSCRSVSEDSLAGGQLPAVQGRQFRFGSGTITHSPEQPRRQFRFGSGTISFT